MRRNVFVLVAVGALAGVVASRAPASSQADGEAAPIFGAKTSPDTATGGCATPMIYEPRIYRCVPGRLPALLSRFQNRTLRIWEKHGVRPAGFWTTQAGESSQQGTYMLAWDSMAEREKRWAAFLVDPEWIATVAEPETDGQIVQDIESELLMPTVFSSVK